LSTGLIGGGGGEKGGKSFGRMLFWLAKQNFGPSQAPQRNKTTRIIPARKFRLARGCHRVTRHTEAHIFRNNELLPHAAINNNAMQYPAPSPDEHSAGTSKAWREVVNLLLSDHTQSHGHSRHPMNNLTNACSSMTCSVHTNAASSRCAVKYLSCVHSCAFVCVRACVHACV